MKWRLENICYVSCLLAGLAWGAAPVLLPGSEVESLLDLARQNNPELAAVRLEAEAAEERVYSADSWPDPVLRTELNDITNQGNTGPSLQPSQAGSASYQVMQAVPIWGKRGLKREVAEAEAQQVLGRSSLTWTEL